MPATNGGLQTVNIENLTPAQTKAIEAGGTNNAVIGGSLEKRGIFEKTEGGIFRYMPTEDFRNFAPFETAMQVGTSTETIDAAEEKKFASDVPEWKQEMSFQDAMEREETETETSGTSEAWQIAQWQSEERDREIQRLRAEFESADDERREEIQNLLPQYGATVPDIETEFAEAIDAGDAPRARSLMDAFVQVVPVGPQSMTEAEIDAERNKVFGITRDPKETRYAKIERWTDDNLLVKYGILHQRLARRGLLKADRMQAERHCQIVENELLARGIRPGGK